MQNSFFFDAVVTDGTPDLTYSASDLAREKRAYFTDGVLTDDGLTVTPRGGLVMDLSAGAAVINGYTYVNGATFPFSGFMADASLDRVDLAVIRWNGELRQISVSVTKGTPDTHPVAPTPAWTSTVKELPIAEIYVHAGSTAIKAENITDVRKFAQFAPDKNAKKAIVDEYLANIISLTNAEKENFDNLIDKIRLDGSSAAVLCGDGEYRSPDILRRVEIGRYTIAGDYDIDLSSLLSVDDRYDLVLVGGGGAGGCACGTYSRGGGGGAGAYMRVNGVTLPKGRYSFRVGAGGVGVTEADGGDGGETTFNGFFAPGGSGGKGGKITDGNVSGGKGGEVAGFRALSGGDGVIGMQNESITSYGIGAGTFFGNKTVTESTVGHTNGTDATGAGCGGSGGCCPTETGTNRGGNGADGCVIIYGYRRGLFNDVVA